MKGRTMDKKLNAAMIALADAGALDEGAAPDQIRRYTMLALLDKVGYRERDGMRRLGIALDMWPVKYGSYHRRIYREDLLTATRDGRIKLDGRRGDGR